MIPAAIPAFPDYVPEKTLKQGPRGSVSVVRCKQDRKRYVYRVFEGSGDVYRKLQTASSPHLPKIYGIREADGQVHVLEEYILGDTLEFLLASGPLPLAQVREIALQICDGLRVLHSINAVHRDIKPENILIRGNEAVLVDFDASRIVKPENPQDTRIMGTTGYAAPEQFGFSQTDARADFYALGVLMNEMLTGQHPSKLLTDGPFRAVIERCIEVNVDKRYADVAQLQAAIRSCGHGRRGSRLALGILAAVLALFVAVGIYDDSRPAETWPATQISDEVWPGERNLYQTPFRYDLDGDGETEEYRFGIFHEFIPREFAYTMTDEFWLDGDAFSQRNISPAVWRQHEDGTWELMEDFAPLLTDARIRVWRGSENIKSVPEVFENEGIWAGGINLIFDEGCLGEWVYELHATLDGQELTALCLSRMIPDP